MNDLISRQQAINAIRDYLVGKRCPDDGTLTCRLIENEVINKLPSIQPERKTGRWIHLSRHKWIRTHKCDQCGNILDFDGVNAGRGDANFCPNCGADMRGEQDGR